MAAGSAAVGPQVTAGAHRAASAGAWSGGDRRTRWRVSARSRPRRSRRRTCRRAGRRGTRGDPASATPRWRSACWLRRVWRSAASPTRVCPETAVPAGEVQRLQELRAAVVEEAAEAELARGCGEQCIGDLEAFVQANPYRERAWGQLMVALYQAGRPADALAAYGRARVRARRRVGDRARSCTARHRTGDPHPRPDDCSKRLRHPPVWVRRTCRRR